MILSLLINILSSTTGKIGFFLLTFMFLISVFALLSNPLDFGTRIWNNPIVWSDNPKNAPPSWSVLFSQDAGPGHRVFDLYNPIQSVQYQNTFETTYSVDFDYNGNKPPTFISLSVENLKYWGTPPMLYVTVDRPDGKSLKIYHHVFKSPRVNQEVPINRYIDEPLRIYLSGDSSVANNMSDFLYTEFDVQMQADKIAGNIQNIIFGVPNIYEKDDLNGLEGRYKFTLLFVSKNKLDSVDHLRLVMGGSHYGLMGTDSIGRDLARGLIFGFPVALTIGLLTSILTTAIGTMAGILSGYSGGKTDIVIQRSCDILSNIPLLPLLLFLAFILGQKLWVVMVVMIAFGWPGLTIIIRSMVLQLRSGNLIEASISIGASKWYIMTRHIFPQIAPFVIAQMIFFTPAAILAEAGLSFLGLGDPSIPTWGQILDQGFRTGAVYIGYWWWVIPPGVLIVITALAFVLLALAMERVVDPRLRISGR